MLTVFTIITTIFIILLGISLVKGWEESAAVYTAILIIGGLICWGIIGCLTEVKATGKLVQKNKYEILIGEDKIIVTNMFTKTTETFEDARTYNIIANKKDKYYLELTEYNMYGHAINTTIVVKDLRFIAKN
jgi:hypothetical protein